DDVVEPQLRRETDGRAVHLDIRGYAEQVVGRAQAAFLALVHEPGQVQADARVRLESGFRQEMVLEAERRRQVRDRGGGAGQAFHHDIVLVRQGREQLYTPVRRVHIGDVEGDTQLVVHVHAQGAEVY